MLSNEVFALECRARYEAQGLVVDARNGEFAHCPQPERYGNTGYYLLHDDHQHQGLLQSKDIRELCFWVGDTKNWLLECDPLPENYFELWDIYEEYSSATARKNAEKVHAEKDELGRSVQGVRNAERLNASMTPEQKTKRSRKAAASTHAEKTEEGKSKHAVKSGKLGGKLGGKKTHEEKNAEGKSLHNLELNKKLHSVKNEEGKSVLGVKNGERLNAEKDELGRSVQGVKNAKRLHAQTWESTIDGFRSTAGPVSNHNRANGWDPNARRRVS